MGVGWREKGERNHGEPERINPRRVQSLQRSQQNAGICTARINLKTFKSSSILTVYAAMSIGSLT